MSKRPPMSRAVRTARGAFGALAATLLAAASHGLAGGTITWLGVIATTVFVLPLFVALAGRLGSVWRLGLGVVAGQALFHWMFSGLGAAALAGPVASGGLAASPHAAHLGMVASFSPQLAVAEAADAWMWAAHAVAAIFTTALLHSGERGAMRVLQVLRDTVAVCVPEPVRVPIRHVAVGVFTEPALPASQILLSSTRLRGPPTAPLHV